MHLLLSALLDAPVTLATMHGPPPCHNSHVDPLPQSSQQLQDGTAVPTTDPATRSTSTATPATQGPLASDARLSMPTSPAASTGSRPTEMSCGVTNHNPSEGASAARVSAHSQWAPWMSPQMLSVAARSPRYASHPSAAEDVTPANASKADASNSALVNSEPHELYSEPSLGMVGLPSRVASSIAQLGCIFQHWAAAQDLFVSGKSVMVQAGL